VTGRWSSVSLEKNKAIVRRFTEELNKGNIGIIDELFSTDFVHPALRLRGLESYKQLEIATRRAFPDLHDTIEDIIAEGDKVCVRAKVTGTHIGEWNILLPHKKKKVKIAPTNKKITFNYAGIYRIVESKIVARETIYDLLDFYKELGVIKYKELPEEI
jgi:predicted ester cyclase